jgi:hypothetical protein
MSTVLSNLDTAKKWIEECSFEHAIYCSPFGKDVEAGPAWLINLEANCITQATADMSYVALS